MQLGAATATATAAGTRHFLLPRTILSLSVLKPTTATTAARLSMGMSMSTAADELKFGFNRPGMYKESLAGTVGAYDRHVFLCYKDPQSWGARVEAQDGSLPSILFAINRNSPASRLIKTKFTVCGSATDGDLCDGDVLIFPDMIKYRGINKTNMGSFVEDVLVKGNNWGDGSPEAISGTYVFVCAHGSRDKRCGVCGPALIERFRKDIALKQLKDKVLISPCSHIGGHKYAGNLIVYGPHPNGKLTGHWYGYVTPDDVPEVLDSHIGNGKIIQRLWRGQMATLVEDVVNRDSENPPSGDDSAHTGKSNQKNISENVGCCPGVEGVSCCQERSSERDA